MNHEMSRLADGLRRWRSQYGGQADSHAARMALKEYLIANKQTVQTALEAVDAMAYQDMVDLMKQHSELNDPGGVDVGYVLGLIRAAFGPDDNWALKDVDDYVNVLKRVVEYAQYA